MPYAIFASQPGGPEVLTRRDITPPTPGPGEVCIAQNAIGLNFIDIYIRQGLYPWPAPTDLILGSEGAGVIAALGEGVSGFQIGQRVAYTLPNGAYATHRVISAAHVVALPDDISDEVAAAAMLKGLTAYYLMTNSYAAQPGDTVLVHAAAGAVGLILGQRLAARGVRAIGTAGGAEKCALATQRGYSHVIDYKSDDFVARVKELTSGAGVQAVYDSVGHDTIMGSLECLANFGTLVSFGQSSGVPDQLRIAHLARGSLRLTRPSLFHHTAKRAWLEQSSQAMFAAIRSGEIEMPISAKFPLDQAGQAHSALAGRQTTGCTLLIP